MRTICLIVEEWNADQVVNDFEESLGDRLLRRFWGMGLQWLYKGIIKIGGPFWGGSNNALI